MKVGDKLKAFKHEGEVCGMEKYVGKIGTIIALTDYDIELEFNDGASWYYPIDKDKIVVIKEQPTDQSTDQHYNNTNGSLYKFAQDHELNAWEFDILKRIVRCRKKGQFTEDLEKTKRVIDLYLKEFLA
jgi:hypothetical protein